MPIALWVGIQGGKNITLLQETLAGAQQQKLIKPGGFDHVVCTLVLCSVPDPEKIITELTDMLKPGGIFVIIEHILSDSHRTIWRQRLLTPLQSYFADGCCLDRPTDRLMGNSTLACLEQSYFGSHKTRYRGMYQKV